MAVAIVDVDDRDRVFLFLLSRQLLEQFRFRFEIIFHRPVIIEMVLGEIGEHGDIPFESTGSFLRQGVRRNFHRGGAASGIRDLSKKFLKIE